MPRLSDGIVRIWFVVTIQFEVLAGLPPYGPLGVSPFVLYTLRHTCITRWAKHIDAYTLHVIAGHTDMNTTKRYVHPSDADVLAAMEKARGAANPGQSGSSIQDDQAANG